MADGNEDGLYVRLGAQRHADNFSFVLYFSRTPHLSPQRIMCAAKQGLGAAYRGHIQENAKMRGDPKPSRVGDALSIDQDQVRLQFQLLIRCQNHRRLAKGQQTRDVGEIDRLLHSPDFHHLQFRVR